MSRTTPIDDAEADEQDVKELRLEHPSGWLALTRHEGVPIIVDALLDLPPHREFNKSELAARAGVARQTVSRHADRLVELNVIEPVPETTPTRYRVADGDVVEQLFELNATLNAAADDSE